MEPQDRSLIEQLAKAVSTQAQTANRIWIALMTVAVFALLPRAGERNEVTLPFSLGTTSTDWFYPVLFAMLLILTIAFSSAHAQLVRAQKLAQKELDLIAWKGGEGIHPRELFDMLRLPSVNRVAPLAQSLRGKFQFYASEAHCPAWLRRASTLYYSILKSASMLVQIGLPALSLYALYRKVPSVGTWNVLILVSGIFAAIALIQVAVGDVLFTYRVVRLLSRRQISEVSRARAGV